MRSETGGTAVRGNPVRIAITGATAIGKTTLGRALAEHLGIPYFEEDLRPIVKAIGDVERARRQGGEINASLVAARRSLLAYLAEKAKLYRDNAAFVSDRTAVDVLTRWMRNRLSGQNEVEFRAVVRQVQETLGLLDWIVVPPLMTLTQQPTNEAGLTRVLHLQERLFIQSLVIGLLVQLAPGKLILIPRSAQSVDQRVAFVVDRMNRSGRADRSGSTPG
jgi:ATPase subunit of ABC transporter with duplicated ATPase domains